VAEEVRRRGLALARRSELARGEAPAADVLLLDSVGELAAVYTRAHAAFVGGSLVPAGGQNPLEPARCGLPIAVGRSTENFRDVAAAFDEAAAWQRVTGAGELAAAWGRWLADPAAARRLGERAGELVARNRGAVERTVALLAPLAERAG
jgi:3-deoxy-D-manno-octulosonic-acid transferase